MKTTLIIRLVVLFTLGASIGANKVDANFFDNLKKMSKKAGGALKKAAHSDIGKIALKAGGVAIAAKAGPNAGALFQGAAQSMHLADEAESAAEESDQAAQQADSDGDSNLAGQHRVTAKMHLTVAAQHRANHEHQKAAYEKNHKRKFDDDYEQNVASKIRAHQDDDSDDSDTVDDSSDDSDTGDADSSDDSDNDGDGSDDSDEDGN